MNETVRHSGNVVWLDDISAARALLGLSLHISGQAAPERRPSLSDSDVDMETQTQVNKLGPKEPAAAPADDSECLSEVRCQYQFFRLVTVLSR